MEALLAQPMPVDAAERNEEQQARWLMAQLLEWHRREEKAAWWEYFRLLDLPLEDYEDERSALAGLEFRETVGGTPRKPVHRYEFPPQEHDVRRGDEVCVPVTGKPLGKIVGARRRRAHRRHRAHGAIRRRQTRTSVRAAHGVAEAEAERVARDRPVDRG